MLTPQKSDTGPGPKAASPVQIAKPAEHSPPPAAAPTPAARPARIKRRHWLLALSFVVLVLVPIGVAAAYLWTRAADQYISRVGFSVRTEEASSAIELLGGITSLSAVSYTHLTLPTNREV